MLKVSESRQGFLENAGESATLVDLLRWRAEHQPDQRGRDTRVHSDARDPSVVEPLLRDAPNRGVEDALARIGLPARHGATFAASLRTDK